MGALLVAFGILFLSGITTALRDRVAHAALFWGTLTGFIIASYTVTDGYSVKVLALSPILVDYAGNLFRTIAFSPKAWRERISIRDEYRQYWRESLGISILTPIGYIFVMFAMRLAPVSHVAPAREMSMIIGAFLGTKLLRERHGVRRMIGTALIARNYSP